MEGSLSLLSLDDERRNLTRTRIRRASMEVVARRGLSATVEEVANLAGVSSRTIFRYYESHDHLMAVTVLDMFEACGLPRSVDEFDHRLSGLPDLVADVDAWIEALAVTFHTRSASIFGLAFWDIHTPRPQASAVLREVMELRSQYRTRGIGYLAATVWEVAGGDGTPPDDLVMAFAVNLSVFTTQALTVDFNRTPEEIGLLTGGVLKTLLHKALQSQQTSR